MHDYGLNNESFLLNLPMMKAIERIDIFCTEFYGHVVNVIEND